jgi:hypothetical protein
VAFRHTGHAGELGGGSGGDTVTGDGHDEGRGERVTHDRSVEGILR